MAENPEDPSAQTPIPDETTAFAGEERAGGDSGRVSTPWSGAASPLSGASVPFETIGDFEILGKLGQGGMGAVYRARQMSLDRQVALKILPASLEANEEFVTRFQREARVAASLNHANLVRVYSSGLADGCHYIAMELIEGETLSQFVRRGPLPPPEALRICLGVARALQCGWDRAQLIHRDIKPGNIFLSQKGEVKVGDLGLAKSVAADTTGLTQTGTAMGTPHYISPEQARGERDLDFRADIYSLGCALFQMLTGQTPYQGRDPLSVMSMHINAPPPAILKVLPQCPIPIARLVGKMLKKVKRERQGSYGELIAEIERAQALFTPVASPLESVLPPDPDAPPDEPEKPSAVRPRAVQAAGTSPLRKSLPRYVGIAAGVVLMGVATTVFWPTKEKPAIVQAAAAQGATGADSPLSVPSSASASGETPGGRNTAAEAPSPADVSGSKDGMATGSWRNVLDLPESASILASPGGHGVTLSPQDVHFLPVSLRDGAIRVRGTYSPEWNYIRLITRRVGRAFYQLELKGGFGLLHRVDGSTYTKLSNIQPLAAISLPALGQSMEMELRAVGSRITGLVNGQLVADVEDSTNGSGGLGLGQGSRDKAITLEAVQYLNLDASPAAPPAL